jgi:hypothetical protein
MSSESSSTMKATMVVNEMKVAIQEKEEMIANLRKEIEGSKMSY